MKAGKALPIPQQPPPQLLEKSPVGGHIDDIGAPMTACFLTEINIDPTNWYISYLV